MSEFPNWPFIDSFHIPKKYYRYHLSSVCTSEYISSVWRLVFTHRFQDGFVLLCKDPTLLYLEMLKSIKLSKLHHPSLSDGNEYKTPVQLLLCTINLRTRQLLKFYLQDRLQCQRAPAGVFHSSLNFLQLQSEVIKEHDSRHVYTVQCHAEIFSYH